ncbi:DNA polymerase/3'-5' exonuclease PolX [Fulvivirga ulvae]|uniref:DNA polymerase/3'-5' exonuclease PolX n=1 Tax=Fulvivirga ulvae TaxID=2904245 RepID=UPI001F25B026|nr:DNA polymerase/3'-5' exonuclease PolX [Fulvivirga ulvae]UII32469.1 DNA polymerase/3'-5' exonuclease PolX [Fulvivirga ulvae]
MDNKNIIRLLKQTCSLMELHGENDFKIKSYNNAIFNLEREKGDLSGMTAADLSKINGVGKSIATAIDEINQTGSFAALDKYLEQTPPGVIELLTLKGIGAKKIRQLWKDLEIESNETLLQAIEEGKLAKLKGFGEKTQNNLKEAILFKQQHSGKLLYAEAEPFVNALKESIKQQFSDVQIAESGAFRRKTEIIEEILFVIASEQESQIKAYLSATEALEYNQKQSGPFTWRGVLTETATPVRFRFTSKNNFHKDLFITTGSHTHLYHMVKEQKCLLDLVREAGQVDSEEEIYQLADLKYIAPELREGQFEFDSTKMEQRENLVEMGDLKGILHNHCTYSDGKHSLEEMATYCKELGYEYLGITDHSKSSFYYANGLYENRVKEQQAEIDELNKKLAPFKIFKGIECDILPDGSLDYDNDTLASFDFIVASIHSAMSMDIEKATLRVLKAVENPFTTILGHMTGRLLLQRDGYPVDHKTIIDACAKNNVVIEINSHPRRLDIDWRWIDYALSKGVRLSINPDAHAKEGYHDMIYGVHIGRKGGLTKEMNLNSMSLEEINKYFESRKEKALNMAV